MSVGKLNDILKFEKAVGLCPYCKEEVKPDVLIGYFDRRDLCQCPSCDKYIAVCLSPGCEHYTKGSMLISQPLCTLCMKKSTPKIGGTILKVAASAATLASTLYIKGKMADK
ncbi:MULTISPECIES: hypothetical protein [unclassified Pseudoalteromonas]|uniref:hypothetical protein n=1 Tax=unclassified Pseudoalteromonas TaxID=194690 RepID=UPI0025B2B971|nr:MULTISPECIES: hypothetical protein [unclassified Pseudoalteromonas]MDN3379175.1 hypothetical protein [Pseudoalteromonas sp. APC 3893]MDN3387670.1 hypothetical protein [Pseudoalteromonas sp. APC 4017]